MDIEPEDIPFDADKKPSRARGAKVGSKKVLSETTKMVGDGLAVGIAMVTQSGDTRKALTMPEAQSIGHPIVRMLSRRVPAWVKPFLPKAKINADDAADIEEILATLGKWAVRLVTVTVTDYIESREKAQAARAQERVMANTNHTNARQREDMRKADPEWAKMQDMSDAFDAKGQKPDPFDAFANIDLGLEVA